ncbi:hypothetical protein F5877DRAFT_83960 [Lentinula edodes]|nr:hypothetical protein F5877DRAFT_83960 [Lentinula edodes]
MSIAAPSIRRLPRLASLPTRSFHLATILEDFEPCDFPSLNLGTESLAGTPKDASGWTLAPVSRTRSSSTLTNDGRKLKRASVNARQASIDRDCMICFHLAQRPSRTKCCGKLFCEAHIHDWLAGSSNQCPSCSAYCHPETIISLACPASPTALTSQMNTANTRPQKYPIDGRKIVKGEGYRSRFHSPSPSSSSSNSSVDPNTDPDDEDNSVQAQTFQSSVLKIIQQFLDDSSLGTRELLPSNNHQDEYKSSSSTSGYTSSQLDTQMFLTPSYRSTGSEVVDNHEMTTVALVGKVVGKVLSIVALMLVFWILAS